MLIATWFHGDDEANAGTYAQTLGDSTRMAHWDIYLRCIDLLAASVRRWQPDADFVVVMNSLAARSVTARRTALWESLGGRTTIVDNTHETPPSFPRAWKNQFFVFDCLAALQSSLASDDDVALLLDSDCLVTGALGSLEQRIRATGSAALVVPYAEDVQVNGMTRRELAAIAGDYQGEAVQDVPYLGGEFIAVTGGCLERDLLRYEELWSWNLRRAGSGEPFLLEEAQLISVAHAASPDLLKVSVDEAARVWTQPWTYRNASGLELPLIAHLPAEKRTGIPRLRRAALDPDSWFWRTDDRSWRRRAGSIIGVPRYGPVKFVRDIRTLAPRAGAGVRRRIAARGTIHG